MSNNLQSSTQFARLKTALLLFLLSFPLSSCTQQETQVDRNSAKGQTNETNQAINQLSKAQKLSEKLLRSLGSDENALQAKKELSAQVNDFKQKSIQDITNKTKNLIYDPDHPLKLFDQLITTYTFVADADQLLADCSEKVLGPKNEFVVLAKKQSLGLAQYLQELKKQREQQKQMEESNTKSLPDSP